MAFCSKCGSKLDDNARFCTACGTTQGNAAAAPPAGAPYAASPMPSGAVAGTPPPAQGSGTLKIILIIVAVLAVIFVLMMATCGMVAYRARRAFHTSTSHDGRNTTVTTPFGTVSTNQGDAAKTAADLGVDVYPGAKSLRSANTSIGKMNVVTADFETSDSVSQVGEFYRGRFPNAMSSSWDDNHGTMVVSTGKGMLTLDVRSEGGGTKIIISRTSGIPMGVVTNQ
jgi:zinc-ribbon domain